MRRSEGGSSEASEDHLSHKAAVSLSSEDHLSHKAAVSLSSEDHLSQSGAAGRRRHWNRMNAVLC